MPAEDGREDGVPRRPHGVRRANDAVVWGLQGLGIWFRVEGLGLRDLV